MLTPHQAVTPLPSGQVFIVICVQICESLNINVLFPFLAFMVEDFGYAGHQLGYFAGILAASFCAAQLTSSYLWGWFSDLYGRKVALLLGTFGAGVGMLLFGLAPSFKIAVLGRFLSGILSGNLGVLKSFLSEITDGSNRGKGFSYLNVAWSVGSILGPLLGGFLCYPVEKYPQVFETLDSHAVRSLFSERPFLLPCLVCVCGNVFTSVCIVLFMVETRQRGVKQYRQYRQVSMEEDGEEEEGERTSNVMPSGERGRRGGEKQQNAEEEGGGQVELTASLATLSTSDASVSASDSASFYDSTVILCVLLYALLAFGDIIGNETLPLFCKLDSKEGGLSLNSSEIGFALSFGGFAGLGFSLFALPKMLSVGNSKMLIFRKYSLVNAFLIFLFPLLGYLLIFLWDHEGLTGLNDAMSYHLVLGLLILTHICRTMATISCFTVVIIFVNHSVVDSHLGKVNGLGQMAAATARSVGPAFGGVLWSQSLKYHHIFTNFIIVSVIMLSCCYLSLRLPMSIEDKKEEKKKEDDENREVI